MTPQVISLSALGSTAWIPVDYVQNPYNINIAIPDISFLIGPVAVYDVWRGKFGGGVMVNFNYSF